MFMPRVSDGLGLGVLSNPSIPPSVILQGSQDVSLQSGLSLEEQPLAGAEEDIETPEGQANKTRKVGKSPHICPLCSKVYKFDCQLKSHMMIHSGERPYQCPQCGKGFTRKDYLTKHQQTHTEAHLHCCPEASCGKSFKTSKTLHQHSLLHSSNKPFICPHCPRLLPYEVS